jgi:hypothetical protein
MDTRSDYKEGATSAGRTLKRRFPVLPIIVVVFALVLAAIIIPHNLVSRLATDEANAAGSLRALQGLQIRYAAEHPSKGFACEFAQLKAEASPNGEHQQFLVSGSFEGYKFSLAKCEADSKGVVVRYRATAVPIVPGKSGVRAFCMDQTGELLFAVDGSPEGCRPL